MESSNWKENPSNTSNKNSSGKREKYRIASVLNIMMRERIFFMKFGVWRENFRIAIFTGQKILSWPVLPPCPCRSRAGQDRACKNILCLSCRTGRYRAAGQQGSPVLMTVSGGYSWWLPWRISFPYENHCSLWTDSSDELWMFRQSDEQFH